VRRSLAVLNQDQVQATIEDEEVEIIARTFEEGHNFQLCSEKFKVMLVLVKKLLISNSASAVCFGLATRQMWSGGF
jgi:hypothetical protein